MPDFPSIPGQTNIVYRDPSTGRLRQGVAGDDFYLSFPSTGGASQALAVGIEDDTPGSLWLYGGSATENSGEVRHYLASDQDSTYDFWRTYVNGTEFAIGVDSNTPAVLISPVDNGVSLRGAGGLYVGINDTQAGFIHVMGHGASNNYGGSFRLYMAADYDTVDDYWNYWVYQDDLYISLSSTGDIVRVNNAGKFGLLVDGSSAGLTLGASSDVHLYRGAADTLYLATGDSLNLVGGDITVTGTGTFTSVTGTSYVVVGVDDATEGQFRAHGATTSSDVGGQIVLDMAADHDATDEYWQVWVYQDDLLFRLATTGIMGYFSHEGGLFVPTTGSGAGITIGGDTQLYRSGTNTLALAAGDTFSALGGFVTVGASDTTRGLLYLYGPATGSSDGGGVRLYMGADHDTTYDFWYVGVSQDNLTIQMQSTLVGQFNVNGGLELPVQSTSAGLTIGGDVQLYRSSANHLTIPDAVTVSQGQLNVGVDDTTAGVIQSYGGATTPGEMRLYLAADADGTFNYWNIKAGGSADSNFYLGTNDALVARFRRDGTANWFQFSAKGTGISPEISVLGSDTNIGMSLVAKGSGWITFAPAGVTHFAVEHVGSSVVNYVAAAGAGTGGGPQLRAEGSDSNIALYLRGKGTGSVILANNSLDAGLVVNAAASAVNHIVVEGQATGTSPTITATGTDAGIGIKLVGKGGYGLALSHDGTAVPSNQYNIVTDHTRTETTGTYAGIQGIGYISPASSSSAAYYGVWIRPTPITNQNLTNSIIGFGFQYNDVDAFVSSGTVSVVRAFYSFSSIATGRTLSTFTGLEITDTTGSGTVTTQYGVSVQNLTKGANNYGVYIAGASTYALWVDSGTTRLDGNVDMGGLPTSNPAVAGRLWNDGGTIKVSSG